MPFLLQQLPADSDNESTNKNNVQQNMTPMLMISGTATKDDWIWTEQLENTTSEEFRDMSDRFCSLVRQYVSYLFLS